MPLFRVFPLAKAFGSALRRASSRGGGAQDIFAAKAALLRARAAAETARAAAYTAAVTARAAADTAAVTTRAAADTAAVTTRATAETARAAADTAAVTTRAAAVNISWALLASFSLWLVIDLYTHEDPDFIAFRVRRTLLASALPGPAAAPLELPVPQSPPPPSGLPLMLLGPTGCGKSTLLLRTARAAAAEGTPVVLVRWRLSESSKGDAASASEPDAALTLASDALFQKIGFPTRRAWILSLLQGGVVIMGRKTRADIALPETRDRLCYALRVLFKAAEDVQVERVAAGMPAFDAAPLLLFDEAHDLIKDNRLASAGGATVFRHLAKLIISYCVDSGTVRAIVAGSSVELKSAIAAAAPYGNRWCHYELGDPTPGVIIAALEARGYSGSDARAIVAECGTRLRLLQEPLQRDVRANVADFIAAKAAESDRALAALFGGLAATDEAALARALNLVAAFDAADAAGTQPTVPQPLQNELPIAARTMGDAFTAVVYADLKGCARFQSQSIARAWARSRWRASAAGKVVGMGPDKHS